MCFNFHVATFLNLIKLGSFTYNRSLRFTKYSSNSGFVRSFGDCLRRGGGSKSHQNAPPPAARMTFWGGGRTRMHTAIHCRARTLPQSAAHFRSAAHCTALLPHTAAALPHTAALLVRCTLPRALCRTATHCRVHYHSLPHYRTTALPHLAALTQTAALPHTAALLVSRTSLLVRAHCRTAAHCCVHCSNLPHSLLHTATCTAAQIRALPYYLPLTAALPDSNTTLPHALQDSRTLLP